MLEHNLEWILEVVGVKRWNVCYDNLTQIQLFENESFQVSLNSHDLYFVRVALQVASRLSSEV